MTIIKSCKKRFFLLLSLASFIFLSSLPSTADQHDYSPKVKGAIVNKHNGFPYPTFNRFIDNGGRDGTWAWWAFRKDDVNFSDERDFIVARKEGSSNGKIMHHDVPDRLVQGDIIRLMTLAANAGEEHDDGRNTATNVCLSINWSNPQKIYSTISSDNAQPPIFKDTVSLNIDPNLTYEITSFEGTSVEFKSSDTGNKWIEPALVKGDNSASFCLGDMRATYKSSTITYWLLKVIKK